MPLSVGKELIKEKKFLDGFNFFNGVLKNSLDSELINTQALFYKGICLTELKLPAEALKCFKLTKKIDPKLL